MNRRKALREVVMRTVRVVGAAICEGGKCLVTLRSGSPRVWEFPGGKVEQGESAEAALVREIREEFNLEIRVLHRLGHGQASHGTKTIELDVFAAQKTGGTLDLREHLDARWVGPEDLDDLGWSAADVFVIAAVKRHLTRQ